jgi:hypothetical protein
MPAAVSGPNNYHCPIHAGFCQNMEHNEYSDISLHKAHSDGITGGEVAAGKQENHTDACTHRDTVAQKTVPMFEQFWLYA